MPIGDSTAEKRILIAQLAESVLSNPDEAFSSAGKSDDDQQDQEYSAEIAFERLSKMRMLLELANPKPRLLPMNDEHTARLALVSLLAIFQDILPTYRIRLPSEKELAVRVTKDVKKIRDYERSLLNCYHSYLKLLGALWTQGKQASKGKKGNIPSAPTPLAITAVASLATLLKSAMNFNFRNNILSVVVQCMNSSCEEIRQSCCSAIREVFQKDRQGDISQEAVKMITNMVKNRDFKGVKADVIKSFNSLPLRVHQDEAEAAKLHEKANKKKRKRDKERAEIEDELKNASGTIDLTLLAKMQAETLHAVTLTYFRILKSHSTGKNALHLLPVALEGLARFSHLINIDTVEDLLVHLKGLLASVDELPLDASLNCILTSFSTLQGPGRELKVDQKEYVAPLYSQLSRICSSSTIQHTNLILRCLNLAFLKRREFSNTRVAAFIKKLLTVAVHAPPYCSASMISFARLLFHRYQGTHQLLENELDVVGSGKYSPFTEDPDYSNPFAAAAWELSALKFHIQPAVSKHAANASLLKNLQLPAESPENVYKTMMNNMSNIYIPFKLSKKKHPLRASMQKNAKRQRQEYRFITPRQTKNMHLEDF